MEQMSKNYSPREIEDKWYKYWEDNGYFHAEADETKPAYTIVIPPPNVTGVLHMGHVLNNTIQDTLVRWKRMQGFNTLWQPGTDHAGIATQNVVERKLAKDGIKRDDLGRNKFVEEVWKWKDENGGKITKQLRMLGASLDWERERFTMDEGLSDSVKEIFVKLYNDDLIYRGEYIVNWCPRCGTALADDEVEHEDLGSFIWEIRYPVKDSDEYVHVATTRPETMLGDTGIAVNPNDERYKHLIGKTVILPLMNREIPVVADDYVDMEFGTGAVKMTPAHDPNDFEIGLRHNLEMINVLNKDATMNENAGDYVGQDRFEAREQVLADLDERKLLMGKKPINHAVGHCYRCSSVIEPRVSKQWFVRMEPLAKKALEVVKKGEVKLMPKRWEKVYYNWLDNIRDWCISRQIWWGHRIPAYYCEECREMLVGKEEPSSCPKCGSTNFKQEDDVLDTWFSSWLWPFSTLGWPEKTESLAHFYPTSTLVTGADILFFWVARMIMAGIYAMDEIPFENVYLHGIVRDQEGRKMSKSLGNSPDPIDIINEYGADALRFSMLYNTSQGQDVFYSNKLIEMGRNFSNKIWNVSKFVMMNLEGFDPETLDLNDLEFEMSDNWILSKLNKAIVDINENLDKFYLNDASKAIYEFLRGDFCDWYVEIAKIRLYGEDKKAKDTAQFVTWFVLEQALRLLHPFMPFITEEIWQLLPGTGDSIMIADLPEYNEDLKNEIVEENMSYVQELIKSIRNIKTEANINPGKKLETLFNTVEGAEQVIIEENREIIVKLANLGEIVVGCDLVKPDQVAVKVVNNTEVYVSLVGAVDVEKEKERMNRELGKLEKELSKITGKLSNEGFLAKAPEAVVEKEKGKQKDLNEKIEKLKKNLEEI